MAYKRVAIEDGKLLYHITAIDNLNKIIKTGLKSRKSLTDDENAGFTDVADKNILKGREEHSLNKMVPFHFFANNPFDGKVKKDKNKTEFCIITVARSYAIDNNWLIIPKHPLASGRIEILSYKDGFDKIDWNTMNLRDYADDNCKSICMAECLSQNKVEANCFHSIYVKDEVSEKIVLDMLKENKISNVGVFVNNVMCG